MLGIIRRRVSVAGGGESIPANEIHYEAESKYDLYDGQTTHEHEHVVSHTFEDGKGIIVFDHDLTSFPGIFLRDSVSGRDTLSAVVMSDNITSIAYAALSGKALLQIVVFSKNLLRIEDNAFGSCVSLDIVELPDSITYIGDHAFYGCTTLMSMTKLPDNLVTLQQAAFAGCDTLLLDSLPDNLAFIGDWAFENAGIRISSIPASVDSIGSGAFAGCTNMPIAIILLREHPGVNDFIVAGDSFDSYINFYVKADSLAEYEANLYWSNYSGRIFAIQN